MKKILLLIIIFILFISGLVLGPALINYEGYFLIVLESVTLQLSIFGLIATVIVLFLAGWLLLLITKAIISFLMGTQDWLFGFSERRRQKAFRQGLISLAEGNYLEAQKRLNKVVDEDDFDGINILALAETESQLGNNERARELWAFAADNEPTRLAANLCIIRDLMFREECKQALTYIEQLPEKSQSDPSIIKLWAHALDQTHRYGQLKEKLPKWKKALGDEYDVWQLKASQGEFAELASKEGANKLKEKWQTLPRSVRKEPGQVAAYTQELINQAMFEEAQMVLVNSQKNGPVPVLYSMYRQLKNLQTNGAIKQLEGWLKKDDKNVDILSTLGQLAFNLGDHLLAEKALSKAIKLRNDRRDLLLLAQIKEAQKDNAYALELYKQTIV
ncbi:heme biosynthesis HemY N-terminal domain-containing protein [Aliiglaciecola litoralis]|uniref:Heme biosynthesis protein HemY n=1 Tax=Aliiglaciecola litoralis TaxID=582857 RepID=A0ABN1LI05_9ALTE